MVVHDVEVRIAVRQCGARGEEADWRCSSEQQERCAGRSTWTDGDAQAPFAATASDQQQDRGDSDPERQLGWNPQPLGLPLPLWNTSCVVVTLDVSEVALERTRALRGIKGSVLVRRGITRPAVSLKPPARAS